MITYNPAFDLFHCIYRMVHIVQCLEDGEYFDIEKVRIWDFYLLFPSKLHDISLKLTERDIRDARRKYIDKNRNPYGYNGDNRKLFEWIRPFQVSALNCLVSCGILSKEDYLNGHVTLANREALNLFMEKAGGMTEHESNTLSFLSLFSRNMPITGCNGLKARTRLLESKYDAE